jgi:hypothetical protein
LTIHDLENAPHKSANYTAKVNKGSKFLQLTRNLKLQHNLPILIHSSEPAPKTKSLPGLTAGFYEINLI